MAYNKKSVSLGVKRLKYTDASKIVEVITYPDFDSAGFMDGINDFLENKLKNYGDVKPILIPCSDGYAKLMIEHGKHVLIEKTITSNLKESSKIKLTFTIFAKNTICHIRRLGS